MAGPLESLPITMTLGELGETDCERLTGAFLAQPVNAITSFAYLAVGAAIVVLGARRPGSRASVVYGICVGAIGLGSVAFHGPQPTGARELHDLPILVTVLFILVHDLELLIGRFERWLTTFVVSAAGATVLTIVSADAAVVLTGMVIAAVAVAEVVLVRRGLRPQRCPGGRWLPIIVLGAIAVAGSTWVLGRTDGPVCDPDSILQLHGLWHGLSALVFGLWWWMALATPRSVGASRTRRRDGLRRSQPQDGAGASR